MANSFIKVSRLPLFLPIILSIVLLYINASSNVFTFETFLRHIFFLCSHFRAKDPIHRKERRLLKKSSERKDNKQLKNEQ